MIKRYLLRGIALISFALAAYFTYLTVLAFDMSTEVNTPDNLGLGIAFVTLCIALACLAIAVLAYRKS